MNIFRLGRSSVLGTSCVFARLGGSCLCMWMTGECVYSQSLNPVCKFRPVMNCMNDFLLSFSLSLNSSASFACTWSLKWRSSAGNKALSSSLHLAFSLPGHEYVAEPSERTPPSEARPERKTGNLFAQCFFLRLSCGACSRVGNVAFSTFPQSLLWLILKAWLAANFYRCSLIPPKFVAGVPRTSEHTEFTCNLPHEPWDLFT